MKICDLHEYRFEDGLEKIIRDLNDCLLTGERHIQFIHGYHGRAFKDYIQSPKFLQEMQQEGFYLQRTGAYANRGVTEFYIDN